MKYVLSILLLGVTLLALGPFVSDVEAQILPLITERIGADTYFWWADADVELTAFDSGLLESSAQVMDPSELELGVSRIYRVPDISDTNGRNLGNLAGASQILLGEFTVSELASTDAGLAWVAVGRLEVRRMAVSVDAVHGHVSREFAAVGHDRASALAAIENDASRFLGTQIESSLATAGAGLSDMPTENPIIVIHGPSEATLLVAFKGDLRASRMVVSDVNEVWAQEGRIALEVALQPGQTIDALDSVLGELQYPAADRRYTLLVEEAVDTTTHVRLEPSQEPTGSTISPDHTTDGRGGSM